MSDFSGLDAAAASAIDTDFFDAQIEVDDLDGVGLDAGGFDAGDAEGDGLPDPIDGADAPDITFGGTAVGGHDLIVASDGTAYEGYADFVAGNNPLEPLN